MNKNLISVVCFPLLIFIIFLSSCKGNDDDLLSEGTGKRIPVAIKRNNKIIASYTYDDQNRIRKIGYPDDSWPVTFTYDNDELVKITFEGYPKLSGDLSVDGIRTVEFTNIGENKIVAKLKNPTIETRTDTIYLNDQSLPIKVNLNGSTSDRIFSYDDSGRLIKYEMDVANPTSDYSLSYEYDDKPGTASHINCPKWFFIYYNFFVRQDQSDNQFFNYKNNIIRISNGQDNPGGLLYNYTYDNKEYPVLFTDPRLKEETAISYKEISH